MYGRHRITDGRYTDTKAKQLAGFALQKLSEQASLHAMDPVAWGESYISMAQLRDDILRDEFSASRRTKLWEKVQKKVESNSNVRPMVREGRTGDVGRVWEWIGAIGAIDKTPHSDRRKSGGFRDSLGGIAGEKFLEPGSVEKKNEDRTLGKWEEKQAYY
jgi:hypothetical protein